jgi:CDP-diacylglycerol--glycerol-3-phosphate 3-phosphatidyltransferase
MIDKSVIKERFRDLMSPVVDMLDSMGVTPMGVSLAGLSLSVFGALFTGAGRLVAGGIILAVASICDTLDGSLARKTGKTSKFGAFFDSTADRISEFAYFAALALYYSGRGSGIMIFFTLAALAGSFLTSYTRARAEGLGLECSVGILERPERVILMIAGLLFGGRILDAVIILLAILSIYTFIQRVLHVRNISTGEPPEISENISTGEEPSTEV